MLPDLTAETVLTLGGWDRRHARVLVTTTDAGAGLALVDSNGDLASIEVEVYWRRGGEWEVGGSSGPAGSQVGEWGWGEFGRTADEAGASDVRYAYGRAAAAGPQIVTIPAWGRDIQVVAADGGWWIWIETTASPLR